MRITSSTQKANGILGVGPSHGMRTTLLSNLFQDRQHVQSSIFSICLAEWGGRLVVGGYNKSYHTGPIHRIALINGGAYRVRLTGMRIAGRVLSGNWGSAMIDSGTTYTYMGSRPYHSLRNEIESHCRSRGKCGTSRGTCWSVDEEVGLAGFPTVEVIFEGSVVTEWHPKSYLYRKGKGRSWCYAFQNDGANANTVLGASWMIHKEIIFDMSVNKIGIVNAKCPEYTHRPRHNPAENKRQHGASPAVVQLPAVPAATSAQSSGPGNRTVGGIGDSMQAYEISFAVVGVLLTCAIGGIARVLGRKGRQTLARLDEDVDESGLPPQIVGNVHEHEALANSDGHINSGEDEDHQEHSGGEAEALAKNDGKAGDPIVQC